MIIGIDIDGVLTNLERFQLDYGSKYYFENFSKKISDPDKYKIKDIYNINIEKDDMFWEKYLEFYAKNEPARPFAGKVIKKLKNNGHEIYIITARDLSVLENDMKTIVKKWLEENKIIYDKLIFSPEDKRKICKENNVDVMIEDAPKNIAELSEILPKVICFNALYNKHIEIENVIRCYRWYDIYDKILNIND